jgi:hypothetical protein
LSPQSNPGDEKEEYPDFRGRRAPSATGVGTGVDGQTIAPFRQHPSAVQSDTQLLETPRLPGDEEPEGANSVTRRSFREMLHQKMAGLKMPGLKNRHSSSDAPDQIAARTPLAAGAAPSGWDVRIGGDSLARPSPVNPLPDEGEISDTGLVNLDAPLEQRSGAQQFVQRPPNIHRIPLDDTEPQIVSSGSSQPGTEPVRMDDPPRLNFPPSSGESDSGTEATPGLAVSRMVVCRQVRGFDDVVGIHPQRLRRGQPILVYAALDNFLSIATAKGYRTLTSSTLEIQGTDGDVVLRMPLGTAVDLCEVPRQDFYLTHRVTIPENLPAGDYIFDLRIDDLQSHESSRSQLAVTVTGDRTHPDGTGDTSKFATLPDSFLR